ncbi:MAG TPA: aspartate aminotransferase family protein, partial [Flavisolibacter sp.]|nr:aspartate aminotransferase family protein [Flavisolibacter sp.]
AGTLSGNPLAMIAGFTLLSHLKNNPAVYTELEEKGAYLKAGLQHVLAEWGHPFVINHMGSMISVHFSGKPVVDFSSAASANNNVFNRYFHAMLDRGIYLPPSAYESWFLSNSLSKEDLDNTIAATRDSLDEILG